MMIRRVPSYIMDVELANRHCLKNYLRTRLDLTYPIANHLHSKHARHLRFNRISHLQTSKHGVLSIFRKLRS